jgi:hypothetical protein
MVEGLALSGAIPARADAGASAFGSGPLTTSLAAPVLQQVSAAVSGTLSGPLSGPVAPITELRLSPEELGSVRIEVTTDGDKVAMVVAAERQDTQDLLRRHADRLMAELREAGFARLDLSFGAWSGPPGDERASDLPLPPPVLDGPSDIQLALAPSGPTASRAAVAAGLYLRI